MARYEKKPKKSKYDGPDANKTFKIVSWIVFIFVALIITLLIIELNVISILAIIIGYYVAINATTAAMFFVDKMAAKKGYLRMPEKSLHTLEFLGGALISFFVQKKIRHKNKKESFKNISMLAIALHIIILIGIVMLLLT